MKHKTKSAVFDAIQFCSIVVILFTGKVIASDLISLFVQCFAVFILVIAVWEMRRTKYYRIPDVGKQAELVTQGIYKYIRNPMYLSQLLFFGIMIMNTFTVLRFGVYVIFLTNFIYKIQYEEDLLQNHFSEFSQYKRSSWRFVPYFY